MRKAIWLLLFPALLMALVWRALPSKPIDESPESEHIKKVVFETYYTEIDDALWAWNIEHRADSLCTLDTYPVEFSKVIADGYLKELPDNPFGTGKVAELKPGEPNRVGCFRYIPHVTTYTLDDKSTIEESDFYSIVVYTPAWTDWTPTPAFDGRLGHEPHMLLQCFQGYRGDWDKLPAKTERVMKLRAHIVSVAEAEGIAMGDQLALARLGY